ncbi:hypothetical protein DSUL_20561 [Desulfovibrionales bacterium]
MDFTLPEVRTAFPQAIVVYRKKLGITYFLFIGSQELTTADTISSYNQADPDGVVDLCRQTGVAEVD